MSVLHMSAAAGVLILGILLFRTLFLNQISKKFMIILWEIAILRLLLPVSVAVPLPDLAKYQNHRLQAWMTYEADTEENTEAKSTVVSKEPAVLNGKSIVAIIYFSGMIFMVLGSVLLYIRDSRILREGLPVSEDERKILTEKAGLAGKELQRFAKMRLLITDRTAAPVTYGVFRPCIIFPKGIGQLQERETGFYISHELIHIKNHDNLKKLIAHAALCVHWFNPLVWVMYLFFNRDIELLCDETVIRRREESRKDYALTLLSTAERRKTGFIAGSGFGKGAVEERIVSVMKFKKTTFWGIIVSVAVVAAALTVFITNTVKQEESIAIVPADDQGTKSTESYQTAEGVGQEIVTADTAVEEGGFSERLKEEVEKLVSRYKDYGLSAEFTEDDYQLYYNGEPVCWFADNQNGADAEEFKGSFFSRPASEKNGYGAVVTKRDENGKLEGLVYLTKEEAEDYQNGIR